MRYVFTKSCVAPNAAGVNVSWKAGDEIEETDLLPGTLESCKATRLLAPAPPPLLPPVPPLPTTPALPLGARPEEQERELTEHGEPGPETDDMPDEDDEDGPKKKPRKHR